MDSNSLRAKTISSMIWVALQRFGTMALSFIANLVLANLLTPNDFGCIGLLAIFIALSQTFIDGGFGAALIQKDQPTQDDFSTIFFWNIGLSLILYGTIYLCAPLVAGFYEMPILTNLLRVQAIILIINAFAVVPRSLLRKRLQFNSLAIIDLLSAAVGISIGIILAFKEWGVWSLIAYQLSTVLCQITGLWIASQWKPSLTFNTQSFKSLFKYGGFLLMSDLLNTFCDNIQGLVIGKRFSATTMGYYSQAKKLEEMPTTSIAYVVSQVAFPVFSNIKDDQSSLSVAHRQCIHAANFINIPLMLLLIVIAEPLVLFLYTDKWIEAVPFFQILCVSGLVNSLQSINYHLYVAKGHSKSMFKWNILKRVISVTLIFCGAAINIEGLLWGMVIGFWVTFIINASLAGKVTGYALSQQLRDLVPILLVSSIACGVSYLAGISTITWHYLAMMALQIISFGVTFIVLSFLFKLQGFNIYKDIVKKGVYSLLSKKNDR